MSAVAEIMDYRQTTSTWLQTLVGFYCKDIQALPDDAVSVSPGGVARSPSAMSAEVVGLMQWLAKSLRGEMTEPVTEEQTQARIAVLNSKAAICEAMSVSSTALAEAITSAEEATFAQVVTPPWQMDASLFMCTQIVVNHVWYHDGQINLIQALNGDSVIHWMD
jgi:hypothetical protein